MKARDYAPQGPIHKAPTGPYVDYNDRADALADALRCQTGRLR